MAIAFGAPMSFAYMRLYTGDYLRDTQHLSCSEHGIYLKLLMYCWDQKGPVPLDERKQHGIVNARSGDEVEAVRRILAEFFVRMGDGHYNKRISEEIAECAQISSKRSAAGVKSASAVRSKVRKAKRDNDLQQPTSVEQVLNKCSTSVEQVSVAPAPTSTPTPTPAPVEALSRFLPTHICSHLHHSGEVSPGPSSESLNAPPRSGDLAKKTARSPATRKHRVGAKSGRGGANEVEPRGVAIEASSQPPGSPRPAAGSATWDAYCSAYLARYGVEPVRNAKTNAQMLALTKRIGIDESPGVARSYLANRNSLYVNAKHCTDLLLRDAEKLRTEWATGNVTHQRDAREEDRLSSSGEMWRRIGKELAEERKAREMAQEHDDDR